MMRILLASFAFIFLNLNAISQTTKTMPNVVVILADDMGMGDAQCYGATDVRTPNIDAIAEQGVRFTQAYVSASVCGPSRAGLMTGVYQQRFGSGENTPEDRWLSGEFPNMGLPLSQPIISEMLKEKGYQTQMVGKWHLGFNEERDPLGRGFDEFYGFLNGSHDYYTAEKEFGTNIGLWPIFDNRVPVDFKGYTTEVFTDKAVNYIKNADSKTPFFVYLSYNAVHHPWQVPQSYIDRLDHIDEPDRRKFAGMLLAMDDGIGNVIEALKEKGEFENTILIFFSDNGSPSGQSGNMSSTGGYRGWKGDTYEGGIRVPFVMSWPNQIPEGIVYEEAISALDIAPTITNYIGVENPTKEGFAFDGVNILPFIKGEIKNTSPHETMFWRRDSHYAIRQGDWKLTYNHLEGAKPMLFDMRNDAFETTDLSDKEPDIFQELQHQFNLWDTNLPDNKYWGGPINRVYNYEK